jgi:hypothetical protein
MLFATFSITSHLCRAETDNKVLDPQEQSHEDNGTASDKTERTSNIESASSLPKYRPPKRGAPQTRIGGGTRGPDDNTTYIAVVTPPHTGHTAKAQPTLFWFISDGTQPQFEFTLINNRDIDPMVETTLNKMMEPGIHAVHLSDYNITLEQGKSYQWTIAAVLDADHRSRDILSSGRIRYTEASQELKAQLKQATPKESIQLYAEAGYWYDAYATLSELISEKPNDPALLEQRVALLRQAELPAVSNFAAKHADK